MGAAQFLPYVLGAGTLGAFIAALRWGRQDSADSVTMAKTLRDQAVEDADTLREERTRLEARVRQLEAARLITESHNDRLKRQLEAAGLEPVK